MEKFCDFITNPDWWSVILSAISTIAVIVIAVVQIRLQKRQTKLQKFEGYKELYEIIQTADWYVNEFYHTLYVKITILYEVGYIAKIIEEQQHEIVKLEKSIAQHVVDFELKVQEGENLVNEYRFVLLRIVNILSFICRVLREDEGIKAQETEDEKTNQYSTIINNEPLMQAVIVSRISDEIEAERLNSMLNDFNEYRDELLSKQYLREISKHCKID